MWQPNSLSCHWTKRPSESHLSEVLSLSVEKKRRHLFSEFSSADTHEQTTLCSWGADKHPNRIRGGLGDLMELFTSYAQWAVESGTRSRCLKKRCKSKVPVCPATYSAICRKSEKFDFMRAIQATAYILLGDSKPFQIMFAINYGKRFGGKLSNSCTNSVRRSCIGGENKVITSLLIFIAGCDLISEIA